MKKILAFCLLALGLTGCVPSLNPFFNSSDYIFDEELVRKFDLDKEKWEFTKGEEKGYGLTITDSDGKPAKFKAHLGKIGKNRYLELFPDAASLEGAKLSDFYKLHLRPVFTVYLLEAIKPELKLRAMATSYVEKVLKESPEAIRHTMLEKDGSNQDQGIVLTATTKELQAFIEKHADKGLFEGN